MIRRIAFLLWLLLPLGACASGSREIPPGTPLPADLSVEISADRVAEGKHTYLLLRPGGQLLFGGGRDAVMHIAQPVCTLSPEQLGKVWDLIVRRELLATPNISFEAAKEVSYRVSVKAGGVSRSFRTIDHQAPGVEELHDLLFEYQGDVRYKTGIR